MYFYLLMNKDFIIIIIIIRDREKKNCLTEEGVYLAQTFSKIRLETYIKY